MASSGAATAPASQQEADDEVTVRDMRAEDMADIHRMIHGTRLLRPDPYAAEHTGDIPSLMYTN
ncbi:jg4194, partial [Pararge aegeria aegeria]